MTDIGAIGAAISNHNSEHAPSIRLRELSSSFIYAACGLIYLPLSEWLAIASFGTDVLLHGQAIFAFPLVAALLGFPVLIVCLFFQRTRRRSLVLLGMSAIYVPCCVVAIYLSGTIRMNGIRAFTVRSQPLISAIKGYERDHSSPPPFLDALVPKYLSSVPTTGMMAYPKYEYHTGPEAEQEYADNPWVLLVCTPSGGINFDMVLYFPSQNYPERGYGGSLRPVGDWAYVHE